MLLFVLQVNPQMSLERKRCYAELGYLMQLIDDYTDIVIDSAEGVRTLITASKRHVDRLLLVHRQINKVRALFAGEYSSDKLLDIYAYIDLLLLGAGLARTH